MSQLGTKQPKRYSDGRTKQSYASECDIVKIMARAEKAGTISHLQKFQGVYADYSDYDFQEQTNKLTQGREIFDALPAEIRSEFNQSPAEFFQYVNDPANQAELGQRLPALAQPGRQLPQMGEPTADQQRASALASEPVASVTTTPRVEPTPTPEPPPTAPQS